MAAHQRRSFSGTSRAFPHFLSWSGKAMDASFRRSSAKETANAMPKPSQKRSPSFRFTVTFVEAAARPSGPLSSNDPTYFPALESSGSRHAEKMMVFRSGRICGGVNIGFGKSADSSVSPVRDRIAS